MHLNLKANVISLFRIEKLSERTIRQRYNKFREIIKEVLN